MKHTKKQKLYFWPSNHAGFARHTLIIGLLMAVGLFAALRVINAHASAASITVKSGVSGFCLDVHQGLNVPGTPVDSWGCNSSAAQAWSVNPGSLVQANNTCLSLGTDNVHIVINSCDGSSSEVWLKDQDGFFNPSSGLCLSLPDNRTGVQLVASACSLGSNRSQSWTPTVLKASRNAYVDSCGSGSKGQRVACYAEKEWANWQAGTLNHNALLNSYSDGNGYEEWCADFVSYVYKEAGYPFTSGERDNWDEYNANNIQYQGFTLHPAGSYIPKAGDVAFFNYNGGHVEIVVSGGSTPTFIYGDSATIDPYTGNGDMAANTKTSDGNLGEVQYYLTPN